MPVPERFFGFWLPGSLSGWFSALGVNSRKSLRTAIFFLGSILKPLALSTKGEEMKEKKKKFALWIYPSTMETIERYLEKSECRSKSDFIEKAILFYAGFLAARDYKDYIPNVVISVMKAMLASYERRTSNIMFKVAVEISMMNCLLGSKYRIREETLKNLRSMCVQEVKRCNGSIALEDSAGFFREDK